MILQIPELKSRFAAKDQPTAKDFSDLVDTVISAAQNGMTGTLQAYIDAKFAALPTGASILVQNTPPAAAGHTGFIWLKTDAATGALVRCYNLFTSGGGADNKWHSRHPVLPGTVVAITDPAFDIASIASYDGGGAPGTGAMWEWPAELKGIFLLGASGAYAINTTGGEAAHVLGAAEMPVHSHGFAPILSSDASPFSLTRLTAGNSGSSIGPGTFSTGSAGTGAAHNNLPPYRTAYLIRRTSRLDYIESPGA